MPYQLHRRALLHDGSLWLFAAGLSAAGASSLLAGDEKRLVRAGLITDLHYADKPPAGTRHYRETLAKLADAGEQFERQKPDLVIELGDLIDSAGSLDAEKEHLKRIAAALGELPGEKHYVLGNHCVHTLKKEEFLEGIGREKPHYSFDSGGVHFVVLDACFRSDGRPYERNNFKWTDANLPAAQVEWLAEDLKASAGPAVVLVHQRLDVENDYGVKNAAQVRGVLEASGKVAAVFQGHSHKNDLKQIHGIPYCTLVAMVEGSGAENNGYSLLDVFPGGSLRLTGFRRQKGYEWE